MPRNRSQSTTSATNPPSPALISRGFASLRRAHRRLSTSSPSSPIQTSETTTPPIPVSNALQVVTNEDVNDSNVNLKPKLRLVPNVGLSCRSFVFDIIDRELESGVVYRIGRFSDRNSLQDRLSFKSKVVSRNHAELWTERGKVKKKKN
jgi:pSer/pThr/pTyr-binding forkhead associated (FHA) protein